jgi:two-component system response regulator NreC
MTKVLLAEDHTLVRGGIRMMLESAGSFEIVGEAPDGRAAVTLAESLHPDIALLDVAMPLLNGVEAARQIHGLLPDTKVVMLSMRTELQYVREALRAGASGYVLKDAAFEELLLALSQVLSGTIYLSPAVAAAGTHNYLRTAEEAGNLSELDKLTKREREVLQMIAEGHSGPEIARELGLSSRTVETHRVRIMMKLDLHSIADLTRFAIRNGVCSPEN